MMLNQSHFSCLICVLHFILSLLEWMKDKCNLIFAREIDNMNVRNEIIIDIKKMKPEKMQNIKKVKNAMIALLQWT